MARKNRKKPTKEQAPPKEAFSENNGITFVTADGQVWHDEGHVTADVITQLSQNIYYNGVKSKLSNLIFHKPYNLEIQDEQEELDEGLTKTTRGQLDSPEVNFWQQMKNCWDAWFDAGAYLYNPVLEKDENRYKLAQLRNLPPFSFKASPGTSPLSQGAILQGIILDSEKQIQYYQLDERGSPQHVDHVFHAPAGPTTYDIAGIPLCYPLIPIIKRLDFAWLAQMQKTGRVGAPSLMIRITKPVNNGKRNDIAYAKKVLKYWGKNNAFPILENMEVVDLHLQDNATALDTINALAKLLVDHSSPANMVSKEGTLIGGSSEGETALQLNYIRGIHSRIVAAFTPIIQKLLAYNGYGKYRVVLTIPEPEIHNSELDLERAKEGREARNIDPNEHRRLLGLESKSEEELAAIRETWGFLDGSAGAGALALNQGRSGAAALLQNAIKNEDGDPPKTKTPEQIEEDLAAALSDPWKKAGDLILEAALKEIDEANT